VFEVVRLSLEMTTSSSRIFLKILFQEMSENMGVKKLAERFDDEEMEQYFEGIFPKDHPKNLKFVINFFTSIGLGALTVKLRMFLKDQQKR
jgi:pre-mRNA-splicing factor CWC22